MVFDKEWAASGYATDLLHKELTEVFRLKFDTTPQDAIPSRLRTSWHLEPDDMNDYSVLFGLRTLATRVPDLATFQRRILKARDEQCLGPNAPQHIQEKDVWLAIKQLDREETETARFRAPILPVSMIPPYTPSPAQSTLNLVSTMQDDSTSCLGASRTTIATTDSLGAAKPNRLRVHCAEPPTPLYADKSTISTDSLIASKRSRASFQTPDPDLYSPVSVQEEFPRQYDTCGPSSNMHRRADSVKLQENVFRKDSLAPPKPCFSGEDSSGDDNERPDDDNGEGTDVDDIYDGNNSDDDDNFVDSDASADESEGFTPGRQRVSRKRPRFPILDSGGDSGVSTERVRLTKKSKANIKSAQFVRRMETRAVTKNRRNPWDGRPEHHYFFKDDLPNDWYIKNQAPTTKAIDELRTEDITKFIYPIEVAVGKGKFEEQHTLEQLRQFMQKRGIVPVCNSTPGNNGIPQSEADVQPMDSATPTPSTNHDQTISSNRTSASPRATTNSSCADPAQRSCETIDVTENNEVIHPPSYAEMNNTTTAESDNTRPPTIFTLQKEFLREVCLHTSIATHALEPKNNDVERCEHLSTFMHKVQTSWDTYQEALRQKVLKLTSLTRTKPTGVHFSLVTTNWAMSQALKPDDTPTCAGDIQRKKRHRADSFSLTGSPPTDINPLNIPKQILSPSFLESDAESRAVKKSAIPLKGGYDSRNDSENDSSSPAYPNRFASPVIGHPHCAFCKKPPVKMRLTPCKHVVCFDCYSTALDAAYDRAHEHPACPTCGLLVSKAPLPYE